MNDFKHDDGPITPVRLDDAPASPDLPETKISQGTSPGLLVAVGVVLTLLVVGFLWMIFGKTKPSPDAAVPPAPEEPVAATPVVDVPVEKMDPPASEPPRDLLKEAQEKEAAEKALGEFTALQSSLKDKAVSFWGGDKYAAVLALSEKADTAMLDKSYAGAEAAWSEGVVLLKDLSERVEVAFDELMASGQKAYAAEDAGRAKILFEGATKIRPEDAAAKNWLARSEKLPQVLILMAKGAEHEGQGDLDFALAQYTEAFRLDKEVASAEEGVGRVKMQLNENRYQEMMSRGYALLNEEAFEKARKEFLQAQAMRPEAPAVKDALIQVEEGMRNQRIRILLAQGQKAMKAEAWSDAVKAYEEALAIDPTVLEAKDAAPLARLRLSQQQRMQAFVDKPSLFSLEQGRQQAELLLSEVAESGPLPPGIQQLHARFGELLRLMTSEIEVIITSDGSTQVQVYKVGKFDPFTRKSLMLRPGKYQLVGSRDGYRDFRDELEVLPGSKLVGVNVSCREKL